MVALCWGLGTGSNFLLLPHKASSHGIHYGYRSPTGMCSGMKNLSLISPSSDSPLSKMCTRKVDEVHWQIVHYFPVTGINSWRKRTFLPSWKWGQVGWLQKHWECCEAARVLDILCHQLCMWHQEIQLFFLCKMKDQNSIAQDPHQDHNSIIYTWRVHFCDYKEKETSLPDVYHNYSCIDEEPEVQ